MLNKVNFFFLDDLDPFTYIYLLTMLIIFIISFLVFLFLYLRYRYSRKEIVKKLNELNDAGITNKFAQMNDWCNTKNKSIPAEIKKAWKSYYNNFKELQKGEEIFTPDVYDFFLEEHLVKGLGKRKIIEVFPGIFLSAGILGTFIGLVLGLEGLGNDSSTEALKDGVLTLIGGMKIAFYTSILGIILSVLWQLLDKIIFYPLIVHNFQTLRNEMDLAFPTKSEGSILQEMASNQKNQMADFQDFMSDVLIHQLTSGITEAIQTALEPQFQQTNDMMRQVIEQSSQNQLDGINEMVDHFVTSLNEITGDHMKDLGEALRKTVEWQEKVHTEMTVLVQSMQASAKEQSLMVEKTTKLTEQIHGYTDQISEYQSVLERTVFQLNETTDKNKQLQDTIAELLEKMTEERKTFNDYFSKHIESLKENVASLHSQTNLQMELQDKYGELMDEIYLHLQDLAIFTENNQNLSQVLGQQGEIFINTQKDLKNLLDEINHVTENNLVFHGDLLNLYSEVSDERKQMSELSTEVRKQLLDQLGEMDKRVESLELIMASAQETLGNTNEHLRSSMEQFAEHMYQGLDRTFNQFDKELSTAVQHLSRGVGAIQEGIVDLPDEIDKFSHSVKELNKQAEMLIKQSS
ncbi:hypothetical protein DCC39_18000 [Pueribacillus theae]|uniref:MotA/TolQ/ExbB proton channel domain-containing protein n=1 Tax=Pueribacillus theae TaxID=2171751 RepID=A0A2U1JK41_9BACI|nr:anti-phage ZorAB system protein ZorA [Pueribacillus theae]PWA05512.1 hypothetical protein DCC39_18000 [Pueribacillus theae]